MLGYPFSIYIHSYNYDILYCTQIIKLGKTEARRNAFMLCTIHRSINAMLTHYKSIMCPADSVINHNKTINVVAKGYY